MDTFISIVPVDVQITVIWILFCAFVVIMTAATGYFIWIMFHYTKKLVRRIEEEDRRDYLETFGVEKPKKKKIKFTGRLGKPSRPVGRPFPQPQRSDGSVHRESGRPGRPGVHPAPPVPDRSIDNKSPEFKGDDDDKQE